MAKEEYHNGECDRQVVEGVAVDGPAPELADAIRDLQRRYLEGLGYA